MLLHESASRLLQHFVGKGLFPINDPTDYGIYPTSDREFDWWQDNMLISNLVPLSDLVRVLDDQAIYLPTYIAYLEGAFIKAGIGGRTGFSLMYVEDKDAPGVRFVAHKNIADNFNNFLPIRVMGIELENFSNWFRANWRESWQGGYAHEDIPLDEIDGGFFKITDEENSSVGMIERVVRSYLFCAYKNNCIASSNETFSNLDTYNFDVPDLEFDKTNITEEQISLEIEKMRRKLVDSLNTAFNVFETEIDKSLRTVLINTFGLQLPEIGFGREA